MKQLIEHVKPATVENVDDLADDTKRLWLAKQAGKRELVEALHRAITKGASDGI